MRDENGLWRKRLAPRAARMVASEIRELLKILDRPDLISLAGGIPDPELFALDASLDATARIFADRERGHQALQYAPSEGFAPLRQWLVDDMARHGVRCGVDNILLTTGSQQALDLIAKLLMSQGCKVALTAPTYLGALQAFNPYEPDFVELQPSDPQLDQVNVAYVVPDFANPTGLSLDLKARQSLVARAAANNCALIEDAAYRDLRFDGSATPSLLALDIERTQHIDRSNVIYCGTFSKTLSPGLRVGWICAASELIQKLVLAKQAADLHSAPLTQMIVHDLACTRFDAQVSRNIEHYRRRRDAMAKALQQHMPSAFSWQQPEGGMFFWLKGPDGFEADQHLPRAIEEAKVAYVPGHAFFADGSGHNCLRLNFSMNSPERLENAIERLARSFADAL